MSVALAIAAGWAAAPIALILVLMLGRNWSAAAAGGAALALALALALTVFGFGAGDPGASQAAAPGAAAAPATPAAPTPAEPGLAAQLLGVVAEGGFLSATILWILLPALALHGLQQRSGALDALRTGLSRVTPDARMQVLLVGWFGTLFLEGAAGFGTPVALAAPLLVGLGIAPVAAVLLALLGHAVGVSFGALGTPVMAQAALTGADARAIAAQTATLHALLGAVMMLAFLRVLRGALADAHAGASASASASASHVAAAARDAVTPAGSHRDALAATDAGQGGGTLLAWGLGAALAFLLPAWALATALGPELATLGGALVGGILFVAALRVWGPGAAAGAGAAAAASVASSSAPSPLLASASSARAATAADAAASPPMPLTRAMAPYLVLVLAVIATRAWPALADPLATVVLQWQLPGDFAGRMLPLTHPGTLLFGALLVGAALQRRQMTEVAVALAHAARRLLPVTLALLAMLMLSRLMLHAGLIDALQQAAVAGLGSAWPLLAPAVGALGSFVTGSATASNVLFSSLQWQTAEALGQGGVLMLAAQGLGAGVGNIVCPHNIVAGAATVGLAGREAEVLRRTLAPCALYLALGGGLVAALAWA
jgi:lactate permease